MMLRVLLVEDSVDDAELLVIELERSGYNPIYQRVDTAAFISVREDNLVNCYWEKKELTPANSGQWFLTHVETLDVAIQYLIQCPFDVVLLDLSLPDSFGLDTVKKLQALVPNMPVIVLTGADDRELALQAMAVGAQDYLVKDQMSAPLLERALCYAIERKKAEAHLLKVLEQERELNQLKLIHNEKMASLGQLLASVAHELNNPINFIYANLTHVDNSTQDLLDLINLYQQVFSDNDAEIKDKIEDIDLDFLKEDLPKILSSMKMGAERLCELVRTLRNFSRFDRARIRPVNLHEELDSTLLILRDRLKEKSGHPAIEIVKEYGNLPPVECYAGQLNQVFMNILSNAIDALMSRWDADTHDALHQQNLNGSSEDRKNFSPLITIRTQMLDSNRVEITIKDNGVGMSESVQAELFNPFFTTKEVGKGTGLGLSISYQIVTEKHGGQLRCISAPGQGAEFLIEIPIQQRERSQSPVNPLDTSLSSYFDKETTFGQTME